MAGKPTMGSSPRGRDGFQGHVAGTLDSPFIILFEQDGADHAGDRGLVGTDSGDLGAALDITVQGLQWSDAVRLDPVLGREAHMGQDIESQCVERSLKQIVQNLSFFMERHSAGVDLASSKMIYLILQMHFCDRPQLRNQQGGLSHREQARHFWQRFDW